METNNSTLFTFEERDKKVLKKTRKGGGSYKVYIHLRDVGSLTAFEAIELKLTYDLKSRISDLKKYGALITSKKDLEGRAHHRYTLNRENTAGDEA